MWTLKQGAMAAAVALVSVLPLGANEAQAAAISPGVLSTIDKNEIASTNVVQVRRGRGGRFHRRGWRRGRIFGGRRFHRRRHRGPRFGIYFGPRYYRPYRYRHRRRCFNRYHPAYFSYYCRKIRYRYY